MMKFPPFDDMALNDGDREVGIQSSSWGDPTPDAVAQKLTDYYADMFPVAV